MIEIKTIGIWGFEGAIRGMRMPYESFSSSDSGFAVDTVTEEDCIFAEMGGCKECGNFDFCRHYQIGENDMKLCKKLIKGGSEHRKFMRMIHVQAEVRAPRYWWAEMDKYKWVEANSSSTMHLITKRELTLDDFDEVNNGVREELVSHIIPCINKWIEEYKHTSDRDYANDILRSIKQLLPESYMQLRLIDTDYECLLNIYHQRKNHRLSEWHDFCSWIESLLYMKEFLCV